MRYEFIFPEGKNKALTFSFDDANAADKRLVEIFNKYNLKATFHLNSGIIDNDGFIKKEEIKDLYKGHEVACHGLNHMYMNNLPTETIISEIIEDRKNLEKYSDNIVVGFSYPYGEYGEKLINKLKVLGIQYARTVESRFNFNVPEDFMKWHPTCHHDNVTDELIDDFLNPPEYRKLSLFYIWGHSFEFDRDNTWDRFDRECNRLHGREDVWYTTNFEFMKYILAVRNIVTDIDGTKIYNPSGVTVWIKNNNKVLQIEPGATINL